jgi:hypothetical protein
MVVGRTRVAIAMTKIGFAVVRRIAKGRFNVSTVWSMAMACGRTDDPVHHHLCVATDISVGVV